MCSAWILTSVKSQGFRTDVTLSSTSPSPRTLKRQTQQQHSCLQYRNCSPEEFQHSSGWTLAHAYILGVFGEHKHLQTSHCNEQTGESSHIRVHGGFLDSSSKVVFGCRPAVPRAAALHSICLFLPHKGPFLQLPQGPGFFFPSCLIK